RSLGQLDFRVLYSLERDRIQDVRDAVEARPPFVVGAHDVPRRELAVRRPQHQVTGPGIGVPAPIRFEVHRTELPLSHRVVDAGQEAPFLLVLADLEPDLDQLDAGLHDIFLHLRTELQEATMLLLGAEAHDIFDTGAVVPAAIEDDDLAACRVLLDITLDEHLGLLAIGGRRQSHGAEHARTHALGDGLDRPALAGRVASFEYDDDPTAGVLHPVLQMTEVDLELVQFLLIGLALHPGVAVRLTGLA